MPSPRRSRPERPPPIFFLDRGLGRHYVAEALRRANNVQLMAEVYPDGLDQTIDDPTWIGRASAEGWMALTKDACLVCYHQDALRHSTLRVFALDNANLTGPDMAARFMTQLNRIVQRARKPGPYVYVVHRDRIELRWRP